MKRQILVVDDEEALGRLIKTALGRRQIHVTYLQTIDEETIQLLPDGAEAYRMALIDLCLAEGSGIQVAKLLLSHNPQIKIVVMSGYLPEEIEIDGAFQKYLFLPKPLHLEELYQVVDSVFPIGSGPQACAASA